MQTTPRYAAALAVAVEAAERAASILLAECARQGGPRGTGGHCPADEEAELVIRGLLLNAFPDWGYLGEETGQQAVDSIPEHVWLVDPNDGTRSMLRGYRGHAVSIALLRAGEPVLGVVHAVDAPDDAGDRFAWAEGCGPLVRNGRPVVPQRWPVSLGATEVVLVSQSADLHPSGNAACVAPARFRNVASIAYRLALVAAGEGVVGISLNSPCAWDYAGGHALLRAVGGELVDQEGREVVYGGDGWSSAMWVFGGAPAFARELASRPRQTAVGSGLGKAESPEQYGPAKLVAGELVHDAGVLRRAQGCLLGQLAGDSLGSLVEFEDRDSIAEEYPDGPRELLDGGAWNTLAGQPTDDSELALMLARTLIAHDAFDAEAVAMAYARWFHGWTHDGRPEPCGHAGCRPFDIGGTTRRALSAVRSADVVSRRASSTSTAAADPNSQANGALMRVSPLGIWGWQLPLQELADAARADARLTHPNPVCQEASAIFVVAVAQAIREGGTHERVYEQACDWAQAHCRQHVVIDALEAAGSRPPRDYMHQQGWVLTALQNAFFQLLHAPSFEEAVVRTVQAGGDTDTNGAICGALVGAVYGREAVPDRWRRMVTTCRPLQGQIGVHQARPSMFWPTDVLVLAERLVVAGGPPDPANARICQSGVQPAAARIREQDGANSRGR